MFCKHNRYILSNYKVIIKRITLKFDNETYFSAATLLKTASDYSSTANNEDKAYKDYKMKITVINVNKTNYFKFFFTN